MGDHVCFGAGLHVGRNQGYSPNDAFLRLHMAGNIGCNCDNTVIGAAVESADDAGKGAGRTTLWGASGSFDCRLSLAGAGSVDYTISGGDAGRDRLLAGIL